MININLNGRWSFGLCAIIGSLIVLLLWLSYQYFVQETNAYLGYLTFSYNISDFLLMGFSVVLLALWLKNEASKPSDFFLLIYTIFVILPYFVLFKIRGDVEVMTIITTMVLIVAPILFLCGIRKINLNIGFCSFFSSRIVIYILIAFGFVYIYLLFSSEILTAGLDIESSYNRRLEGRDVFQVGAFSSYIISMYSNSVLPLIGFWSAYNRNRYMFLLAIFGSFLTFYFLGLKAPILYVLIGTGFGLLGDRFGFGGIGRLFVLAVFAVFCISFVELIIYDYSYMADYIIRRSFSVPVFLMSTYVEIIHSGLGYWDLVKGFASELPVGLFVGDYLGDPLLNANTNSFFYALSASGVFGYFVDIFIVSVVFLVLDNFYLQHKDPAFLWIGFSFSLLLVEQSSKTALLSSGVALAFIMAVAVRINKK